MAQGEAEGARLLTGDQTGVALVDPARNAHLEHRMALLAGPGDVVLLRRRSPAFEDYLGSVLGLSGVAFLEPPRGCGALLADARGRPSLLQRIVEAHAGRHLTIAPYQANGDAWRLAQAIGQRTGRLVHVAGPSPRMARRANHKLWFADLARRVLGRDAIPPTMAAYGPAAAAGLIARFAREADHVVLKVPDSAGSAGNLKIESRLVRDWPRARLRGFLKSRLDALGWRGAYPILAGVWDADVYASPSVQMHIPRAGDGPPVDLGVFEQVVKGEKGEFVGAAPAALPQSVTARLSKEAIAVAATLQALGYYGRCSLDAVLKRPAGGAGASPTIHWIECNGRWTGVSIPLVAAERRLGARSKGFVVAQHAWSERRRLTVEAVVARLGEILYRPGAAEGVLLLAPPSAADPPTVACAAVAADQTRAEALSAEADRRIAAA
ncbi:MAG: hypothetical protein AAGF90_07025 [Pseudomonadota bacterium]